MASGPGMELSDFNASHARACMIRSPQRADTSHMEMIWLSVSNAAIMSFCSMTNIVSL